MNRPQPVLTSAAIAAAVTGLASVLGFLGFTNAETNLSGEATAIGAIAVGAIAIGSHLFAGLHARGKVTPVESPRAADGTPLMRADALATSLSEPLMATISNIEVAHPDDEAIDFTPQDEDSYVPAHAADRPSPH